MPASTPPDGPKIAYDLQGQGRPVILVAGLASDRQSWGGYESLLARSARVVTFDHRGVGATSAARVPYTIPVLASDVVRLLDLLEIDRADIVGVSMGGMVALELAAAHPDRVRSLVLGCTHPGGSLQILPAPSILDRLPSLGKTAEQMVTDFLAVTHSGHFLSRHPELFEQTLDRRRKCNFSRRVYVLQLGAILTHDVSDRLEQIQTPTLVMSGDDDVFVPLANSVLLTERISGARLSVLHDVGHAFWIEAPERAAHETIRFLAESG